MVSAAAGRGPDAVQAFLPMHVAMAGFAAACFGMLGLGWLGQNLCLGDRLRLAWKSHDSGNSIIRPELAEGWTIVLGPLAVGFALRWGFALRLGQPRSAASLVAGRDSAGHKRRRRTDGDLALSGSLSLRLRDPAERGRHDRLD